MVRDHRKDVAESKKQADKNKDPQLKPSAPQSGRAARTSAHGPAARGLGEGREGGVTEPLASGALAAACGLAGAIRAASVA